MVAINQFFLDFSAPKTMAAESTVIHPRCGGSYIKLFNSEGGQRAEDSGAEKATLKQG